MVSDKSVMVAVVQNQAEHLNKDKELIKSLEIALLLALLDEKLLDREQFEHCMDMVGMTR